MKSVVTFAHDSFFHELHDFASSWCPSCLRAGLLWLFSQESDLKPATSKTWLKGTSSLSNDVGRWSPRKQGSLTW